MLRICVRCFEDKDKINFDITKTWCGDSGGWCYTCLDELYQIGEAYNNRPLWEKISDFFKEMVCNLFNIRY